MATKPDSPQTPAPPHGEPGHPPKGPRDGHDCPEDAQGDPLIVELRIVVPVPKPG